YAAPNTPATTRPRPRPELRLAGGAFRPLDPPSRPPAWYQDSARATSARGRRFLIAVTDASLTEPQRAILASAGASILDYIPTHGYRIKLEPEAEATVRALPFVTWLGEMPAPAKLVGELAANAEHPPSQTSIRVILEGGEPDTRVLRELAGLD